MHHYSSSAHVCGHLVEFKVSAGVVYIKVDGSFGRSDEPDQKIRTRIALKALGMWKTFLKQAPKGYYYCTPAREELRALYLKVGWEPICGDNKRLYYFHGGEFEEGEGSPSESRQPQFVVPTSPLQEVELVEREFRQGQQEDWDSSRRALEENLQRLHQEREAILAQLELLRQEREALRARLEEELGSQKK